jgi:hypothetical protein
VYPVDLKNGPVHGAVGVLEISNTDAIGVWHRLPLQGPIGQTQLEEFGCSTNR